MTTLSGLALAVACPGSASLPHQAREGTRGTPIGHAIHALAQAQIDGLRADDYDIAGRLALAHGLAPDDAGRLAFLAEHLRLPIPGGALAEVPLGYWIPERDAEVTPGRVRRFTAEEMAEAHRCGLRYPDAGQALSGTLDAMWAEARALQYAWDDDHVCPGWVTDPSSTLWVYDLKTGDEQNIAPIGRNWQLRGAAVMAARWTGATRVIPAICYVNAAECALAVREGRPYEGRWEVGAPLDLAALDAIEVEMRAVLARTRGEVGDDEVRRETFDPGDVQGMRLSGGDITRRMVRRAEPPLILGPHCEHCPARGACPALAAEAVSLARASGSYAPASPGMPSWMALSDEARGFLAGLLPALRARLDAIDVAVRAGGPVRIADGREYGPALEEVTAYRTAETFDALAEVVGEDVARGAFEATAASLKRALAEAGAPRGAWSRLRKDLEARGAVVVTAREVWRRRWPALPAEVVSDGERNDREGQDLRREDRAADEGDHPDVQGARDLHRGELRPGGAGGREPEVHDDDRAQRVAHGLSRGGADAPGGVRSVHEDAVTAPARVARPLPADFGAPLSGRTLRLLEGMGFDAPARAALVERYRASVAGQERKAWRESWLHDFAVAERAGTPPKE